MTAAELSPSLPTNSGSRGFRSQNRGEEKKSDVSGNVSFPIIKILKSKVRKQGRVVPGHKSKVRRIAGDILGNSLVQYGSEGPHHRKCRSLSPDIGATGCVWKKKKEKRKKKQKQEQKNKLGEDTGM